MLRRFFHFMQSDQRGMTSIEYGLIIMALSLGIMAAYFLVGDAVKELVAHAASGVEHARSTITD